MPVLPRLAGAAVAAATATLTAAALLPAPGAAADRADRDDRPQYPRTIALPDGFQPEGIATGLGNAAFLGSLADGDVYRVNLRTGEGRVVAEGPGTSSVGLHLDGQGRLFIAGGGNGDARVVDVRTGEELASYAFTAPGTGFVNDVTILDGTAWFTDSANARLFGLPLGEDGALPAADGFTTLPLTGDWEQVQGFNANGIVTAPGGDGLVVVNSTTGVLHRVDPATGATTAIDAGGASVTTGDGMLRVGRTLYVVRNRMNKVDVLRLLDDGSARYVRSITAEGFDVPTTVARLGQRLYLPNARFGTASPETATYTVTQVPAKPRR